MPLNKERRRYYIKTAGGNAMENLQQKLRVIETTGIEQTVDAPPDVDSHIPTWRVHESTRVLRDLGATLTERVYPRVRTQLSRKAMPTKTASGRAFALR